MALVVEDGTGLTNADAYISVANADAYFTKRGITAWAALTNTNKEAGILYATAYIDAAFNWPGYLKSQTQSLDWPRSGAYDAEKRLLDGSVPLKIKDATCELALVHATQESLNTTFDRGGMIKSETVGPLSVEYESGAPSGKTYPFVNEILSSLTSTGSTDTVELIRA